MQILAIYLTGLLAVGFAESSLVPSHRSAVDSRSKPDGSKPLPRVGSVDEVTAGSLLFTRLDGGFTLAPALSTDVDIRITGLIGRTRVVQRFSNDSDAWREAIYAFPLPKRAAVDSLRMRIGERVIDGQIHERQKARTLYEEASRRGTKASLLEQHRPNVFAVSLANIGPKETIEITFEYQEDVLYEQGSFRLRFPTVIAPRYFPAGSVLDAEATSTRSIEHPPHAANTDIGWIHSSNSLVDRAWTSSALARGQEGAAPPLTLRAELQVGVRVDRITSPSHRIGITSEMHDTYRVTLRDGPAKADRDFVLTWTPLADQAPQAAVLSERINDRNYALVMLVPPSDAAERLAVRREAIFIIDTSGSMAGESIEQARLSLALALDRLKPSDRFNVIQFHTTTHSLFANPVAATSHNLEKAKRFVRGVESNGGTEMLEALRVALSQGGPESRDETGDANTLPLQQVIFITDGSVGNEQELMRYIHDNLRQRRLFTVGIGSAPNSHFMSSAARFGRGSFTYVGNTSEVAEKMGELFRKLERPALTDVQVGFDDPSAEIWPAKIPDLYAGEPVLIVARLAESASTVTLSGRGALRPWHRRLELAEGSERLGIARLWARKKIASKMDSLSRGADPELVRQTVTAIALEHHLVSKYTSLMAVDVTPSGPADAAQPSRIPAALPAGWEYHPDSESPGTLPPSGTPMGLLLLAGFVLLIAGIFVHWNRDQSCHDEQSVFS